MVHDPDSYWEIKRWIIEHGDTQAEYIDEDIEEAEALGDLTEPMVLELRELLRKATQKAA